MKNVIIKVEDVSMHFNLMEEKIDSMKEYIVKLLKGKLLYTDFIALKNISFSIEKGDIIGIVGFNGAGKSTILKILAGVLTPTTGKVKIYGSVAPLIEVGAGFNRRINSKGKYFS